MGDYTRQAIIIVPVANLDAESQWMLDNYDPVGGLGSFNAPLSSDGVNIDYYWCGTWCTEAQYALLKSHFGPRCYDGATTTPDQVLATRSLDVIDEN